MKRKQNQLRLFPIATKRGLVIDLFAGGGGASTGIAAAIGQQVDIAINHDETAIETHKRNHPHTAHLRESIWNVKPRDVTGGRPVWILWASPDCKHFSRAKGGVPLSKKIRSLGNAVIRWAKETLASVIFCENVAEWQTWGPVCKRTRQPIKERAGESWKRWIRGLQRLGYVVEHRVLDASLYGAETRRKRLFVVARRDGEPIVWPSATHGPKAAPVGTAAECIDWSIPCPSIFERSRPLAQKTMWRIAQGIRRFVLENPRPFIVRYNTTGNGWRGQETGDPLTTIDTSNRHGLVAAVLQQSGFGERPGQAARVPGVEVPLGTIVAGGQKHALVGAFLSKHYGDPLRKEGGGAVIGTELRQPIGTVTARDHHGLAAIALAKFRGTDPSQPGSASVEEPLPTVSAGGIHVGEVRAFLSVYYGSDGTGGQAIDEPMRTVTAKH